MSDTVFIGADGRPVAGSKNTVEVIPVPGGAHYLCGCGLYCRSYEKFHIHAATCQFCQQSRKRAAQKEAVK